MRARRGLARYNRLFYERCWRAGSVLARSGVAVEPAALRLEIGPGLRPRLALDAAVFVDVSRTACAKLRRAGAVALCATVDALPVATASVGAVHAYDVLEHIEDDAAAIAELARVVAPGGVAVLSIPLHRRRWQHFDRVVGHARRYEPAALVALLARFGFVLDGFAPFGDRPRSRILAWLGTYYLTRRPRLALAFEERFLRAFRPAAGPVILVRAGAAEFVRAAGTLDGAVTSWRRSA
jgi:SAM-dependent methyltransferase